MPKKDQRGRPVQATTYKNPEYYPVTAEEQNNDEQVVVSSRPLYLTEYVQGDPDYRTQKIRTQEGSDKFHSVRSSLKNQRNRNESLRNRNESQSNRNQSQRNRNQSPKKKNQSPKRKNQSPKRKNQSPKRKNQIPKRIIQSPKRKSQSPKRKNQSPKRKNQSPKRKNQSPKRKNQSPKRKNQSPKRKNQSQRNRNERQRGKKKNQRNENEILKSYQKQSPPIAEVAPNESTEQESQINEQLKVNFNEGQKSIKPENNEVKSIEKNIGACSCPQKKGTEITKVSFRDPITNIETVVIIGDINGADGTVGLDNKSGGTDKAIQSTGDCDCLFKGNEDLVIRLRKVDGNGPGHNLPGNDGPFVATFENDSQKNSRPCNCDLATTNVGSRNSFATNTASRNQSGTIYGYDKEIYPVHTIRGKVNAGLIPSIKTENNNCEVCKVVRPLVDIHSSFYTTETETSLFPVFNTYKQEEESSSSGLNLKSIGGNSDSSETTTSDNFNNKSKLRKKKTFERHQDDKRYITKNSIQSSNKTLSNLTNPSNFETLIEHASYSEFFKEKTNVPPLPSGYAYYYSWNSMNQSYLETDSNRKSSKKPKTFWGKIFSRFGWNKNSTKNTKVQTVKRKKHKK